MEKRQYSLDFIKIVATVFILFHHYQQYVCGVFDSGINYYGGVFNFGYMVELFFLLSGYFMYPYIEKIRGGISFEKFYLPRYLRLIPLVAITAVAYQLIVLVHIHTAGMAWFMQTPNFWKTIVAALGFQEGWVFRDNIYVNYPVWYVSVLLVCYFAFYIICFFSKKLHVSARYFCLGFVFVGIAINYYGWQLPFLNEYTARGYCAFFTGVILSTYCYERNSTKYETLFSIGIIALIIDLIVFHNGLIVEGVNYILTFMLFPAVILLFKNSVVSKLFCAKIWKIFASIAFNAFVWHMPLLVALLVFIYKAQSNINFSSRLTMWGFLIIEIVVGTLSHFIIERNIHKFISKRNSVQ